MIIEYGNPTTASADLTTGKITLNCDYTDDTDLVEMIGIELADHERVLVLVSGGIDSQFSAAVAKKHCDNVSAVIFDFLWQGTTINPTDVYGATKFCKNLDLDYEIVEFEIKDFLDNELIDFARKYRSMSPQVSVHLKAITQLELEPNTTILMGGDIPYIGMYEEFAVTVMVPESAELFKKGVAVDATIYQRHLVPYKMLADDLGIDIIKNPFMLTPTIFYASLNHNLQVISDTNNVLNMDSNTLKSEHFKFKCLYYESFGLDLQPPFIKRTGFEPLRMHLAAETGMYDEFNHRYRAPLYKIAFSEKWLGPMLEIGPQVEVIGEYRPLLEKIQDYCSHNEVEFCNTYKIDW